MTDDERLAEPHRGPILLCAGTDAIAAARLAEVAMSLLADRSVVVLPTWELPPMLDGMDGVRDAEAAYGAAADAAQTACGVLEAHGLNVTRQVRLERSPWRVILELGDEIDAAVIVAVASEGSPPHPGWLGRDARALAHRTHRPLLLLPADAAPITTDVPVLFAYDGSAPASHALSVAARLLRPRPAVVASVWHTASHAAGAALLAVPAEIARAGADGLDEASRREAESRASDGAALLAAAGWTCENAALDTSRSVVTAIIGAADEHDAAIVVTGTRGRSRIAAALLGSSAEGILRHADRPVLLVPPATA